MESRDEYLRLLAEEYRTLANSGNQADRHTYTALQWGTALIIVVLSAAVSQWGKHDVAVELAFLLGIPALGSFGMLYWVGELARMRRIYDFMCIVETKAELALGVSGSNSAGDDWFKRFSEKWTAPSDRLKELGLSMPTDSSDVAVDAGPGPIEFERWLRRIRVNEASSNLTWVFLVRFLFFVVTICGSWGVGLYYAVAYHDTRRTASILAVVVGALLGFAAIWLAAELVSDLNEASSDEKPRWLPRRVFRRVAGAGLGITEWRKKKSKRYIAHCRLCNTLRRYRELGMSGKDDSNG